jgi:phage terminase Nu1 subunit (DNA packaging protein)
MALADDIDGGGAIAPEDRAAIDAVPERYRVNLSGLEAVVGRSTNTIRADMRRFAEDYPVVYRGTNGRDYVFDARAVVAFYADQAEKEREAEAAEQERIKGLRLELLGGDSVDEKTVDLSPKDKRELYQAEYYAGQVRRQRGELVRAAEVEDGLRVWNARVRDEMLAAGARIVEDLALDREQSRRVEAIIADALRAAAASARTAFTEVGEGAAEELVG